jgi:UDP-3-O-[3-hydroxymyristoyl] N-acetylglucosamine deacetylase
MPLSRLQRTIARPVAVSGYGYWSGAEVCVEFRPAPASSGITFVRDDLGTTKRIPAQLKNRIEIPRRTCLSFAGAQVSMVEHALAALAGLHIDNCEIGVTGEEMPGCDGSALEFVDALNCVGVVEQTSLARFLVVTETVRLEEGNCWIEASPARGSEFSIDYMVHYPIDPVIGRQVAAFEITPEVFRHEVAPCRTFILQREADELIRQGKGCRVSNRDLLIFSEHGLVENQLRFANECARHKVLDVIGDLALTGCQIVGRIEAYRSGHRLNTAFARELMARCENSALLKSA